VTIRQARRPLGSIRDNVASRARSDHASRGLGFALRSTATSCRKARISASFHAEDRANKANRANT